MCAFFYNESMGVVESFATCMHIGCVCGISCICITPGIERVVFKNVGGKIDNSTASIYASSSEFDEIYLCRNPNECKLI